MPERCGVRYTDREVRGEIVTLLDGVRTLESAGAVSAGEARALRGHLRGALPSLNGGRHCAARARLAAFRRQIESDLDPARGRSLVRVVNRLLNDRVELGIDSAKAPAVAEIAGVGGGAPRPVARFVNAEGRAVDFVANELYLMTDDAAALDAFLRRWNGTVLLTLDFGSIGVHGTPPIHLVRIDPGTADTAGLSERWARSAGLNGENSVSSAAALRLLAAALEETVERRLKVGVNFVLESTAFAERSTTDAPMASGGMAYTPDAFAWPYMNRGSAQDIGTAEAWRVLDAMGRLRNRVRIGVADGGFRPNRDFPDARRIAPRNGLRIPNPGNCGDSVVSPTCTWHGTHVVLAAMGRADNGFGGAGPAGSVAELVMLQSPTPDFMAMMQYILGSIPSALGIGPRIVNISASTALPSEICLAFPACETLHAVAAGFRAAGILVVSSAGNQGRDVDATKVFGFWPFEFREEAEIIIPCELSTVLCVGGLSWDATTKHPESNWGGEPGSRNTVRMFGPYELWSVADAVMADETAAAPAATAGIVSGNSVSTPYVAGVAALVWAANPGLSAGQVEDVLLATAHTGSGDTRVPRWVNALGAVQRAVGGNTPPWARIVTPANGVRHPRGGVRIAFSSEVEDLEGDALSATWRSSRDGLIGTGLTFSRNDLSFGRHTITLGVTDGVFTTTRTIEIDVTNEPPVVAIVAPAPSGSFCVGQPVSFAASVTDLNSLPGYTLPDGSISWRLGDAAPFAFGREVATTFATPGEVRFQVRAMDEGGLSASSQGQLTVRDCAGAPPTVRLLEPADHSGPNDPRYEFEGVEAATGLWYREVNLRGEANDPEDGDLTGAALVWSYEAAPGVWTVLGTGNRLTSRLYSASCTGQWYNIRLVSTDRDGNTSAVVRRIRLWTLC